MITKEHLIDIANNQSNVGVVMASLAKEVLTLREEKERMKADLTAIGALPIHGEGFLIAKDVLAIVDKSLFWI